MPQPAPRCQASAAQRWLEARTADLLAVEYVRGEQPCPVMRAGALVSVAALHGVGDVDMQ
jgi:hypothetical protein